MPCRVYPPAACRGVHGDASAAPDSAVSTGRLLATGVRVDRARRGTTCLRCPCGVLKLAGNLWPLLLLLPSAAGPQAMPEIRPRYGEAASSAAPWWWCCCCSERPRGRGGGSLDPCLASPPSASFGTAPVLPLLCSAAAEGMPLAAAAAARASSTAMAAGVCLNRSLYLSLITGTMTAQSCELAASAAMDPAPGRVIASLSTLRTTGLVRVPGAAGMPLLALPGRAATAGAADAASIERLPPRSMDEPIWPAAGTLVGLRRPMLTLLKPGRRLC